MGCWARMEIMTPKEAAQLAFGGPSELQKLDEEIINAPARWLQEFIHRMPTGDTSPWFHRTKVALEIRLAEDAAKTAEKMATHTDRLVTESISLTRLTKHLRFWTIMLGVFAVVQIVIMVFDYLKHK